MKILTNTYLEIENNNVNIRTDFFDKNTGDYLDMKSSTNLNEALSNEQKKILINILQKKIDLLT